MSEYPSARRHRLGSGIKRFLIVVYPLTLVLDRDTWTALNASATVGLCWIILFHLSPASTFNYVQYRLRPFCDDLVRSDERFDFLTVAQNKLRTF